MIGRSPESGEEVKKLCLLRLADAFEIKDFAEVGVGLVCNVDEVGLYKGFGR